MQHNSLENELKTSRKPTAENRVNDLLGLIFILYLFIGQLSELY